MKRQISLTHASSSDGLRAAGSLSAWDRSLHTPAPTAESRASPLRSLDPRPRRARAVLQRDVLPSDCNQCAPPESYPDFCNGAPKRMACISPPRRHPARYKDHIEPYMFLRLRQALEAEAPAIRSSSTALQSIGAGGLSPRLLCQRVATDITSA